MSQTVASEVETRLGQFSPSEFREIGNTSIGFRVSEEGRAVAAFRPRTRSSPRGYLAEIGAFEIARRLAIDAVPVTIYRAFDEGTIRSRLDSRAHWNALDEEMPDGSVDGALTAWVEHMSNDEALDQERGIATWSAWLRADGPDLTSPAFANRRALARDISTCLVFDYLIGNGDRMSGGNMRTLQTESELRLVVRDHNLAIGGEVQGNRLRRMQEGLMRVQRVSRSLISHLQSMSERELSDLRAGDERVFLAREVSGIVERRREILSYFAAQTALHGDTKIFYFQ